MMKKRLSRATWAATAGVVALVGGAVSTASAAPPVVATDQGAYVRLVGNPTDGTVKFQFGWDEDTPSSAAAGYWIGVYDVTNSHYEWSYDTGPVDLESELFLNAMPTPDLDDGEYKVVMFVRQSYGPEVNIAQIEVPFTVASSMG